MKSYLMKIYVISLFMMVLITPAASLGQTLLLDYGPLSGTNGGGWANNQSGQNFAEKFSFAETTTVGRIDIFTPYSPSEISVHIKILSDTGGNPGTLLYQEDQSPFSYALESADVYRISCNLATPFVAQAGTTYWIGVAGVGWLDIAQYSVKSPGDGCMAQFSGSTFGFINCNQGDMMFQLYGEDATPQSIPTMNEWGLIFMSIFLAFGAIYYLRNQRAKEA